MHKILKNNEIATYTLDRGKTYENIGLASSLDELIEICDLLILSLPQTAETDDMFNDTNLAKMQGLVSLHVFFL